MMGGKEGERKHNGLEFPLAGPQVVRLLLLLLFFVLFVFACDDCLVGGRLVSQADEGGRQAGRRSRDVFRVGNNQ